MHAYTLVMMVHNEMINTCVPTSTPPTQHVTFDCATEAWSAWNKCNSSASSQMHTEEVMKSKNVAILGLEVKDAFYRMRSHFRMFGHLTNATLDEFVGVVLLPNQELIEAITTVVCPSCLSEGHSNWMQT